MKECLVLVGLIGAGKTTEAKRLEAENGYAYVDFDHRWHGTHGSVRPESVVGFVAGLARDLNDRWPDRDVVVDGWWTWDVDWWRNESPDPTLRLLAEQAVRHRVSPDYLDMTQRDAFEAYEDKRRSGLYDRMHPSLADPDRYRTSISDRIATMERRFEEFRCGRG